MWRLGSLPKGSRIMPKEENRQENFTNPLVSKSIQAQFAETGRKISDATIHAQNEFFRAIEEISRDAVACAAAEVEHGLKLSKKLNAAHSVPDAFAAYQEWLSEEISARAEDARRFMTNGQRIMDTGARLFSNGWSSVGAGG
jgi:hypothetical protein